MESANVISCSVPLYSTLFLPKQGEVMAVFNGISIAVFFCALLVFSRFYARSQDTKAQAENDILIDLRARDVNHLIDAIPRCVVRFPSFLSYVLPYT